MRTDDWVIDLDCTGCYKCLNAPPGLSIVSISDKAFDVMEKRKRVASTFSFDLLRWRQQWIPKERGGDLIWGFRRHPIEPAPHLTYALNEAVKQILEEGLQERFKKNTIAGQAIRSRSSRLRPGVFSERREIRFQHYHRNQKSGAHTEQ